MFDVSKLFAFILKLFWNIQFAFKRTKRRGKR